MTDSEVNLDEGQKKPFVIEDWRVDPTGLRVSRGKESTKLEPRTMAVLVYLAEHAGETVNREQLESEIWAGMVVGYDAVSSAVAKLRKALADDERKLIETIPKTGYRLTAAVSRETEARVGDELPAPPAHDNYHIIGLRRGADTVAVSPVRPGRDVDAAACLDRGAAAAGYQRQ